VKIDGAVEVVSEKFMLKKEGLDLVIKGALSARLNELKDPPKLRFFSGRTELNIKRPDKNRPDKSWLRKGFFDVKKDEVLKFKRFDSQAETVPTGEKKQNKKKAKSYQEQMRGLIDDYDKVEAAKKTKDNKKASEEKKNKAINKLHESISTALSTVAINTQFQLYKKSKADKEMYDFQGSKFKPAKLIEFAKYLLEKADPAKSEKKYQKEIADLKEKANKVTTLKVYSPGVSSQERILLFKGERGK
jgi:hypothetical protein